MAVTQEQIDRANDAIATAERQVVLDGQSITYRSIDELKAARDDLLKRRALELAAADTAAPARPKQWGIYQRQDT